MSTRKEGQIWIDRNSPNNLKYYVNGHEYTVEVSGDYPIINKDTTKALRFTCGMVVKLNREGYVVPAAFPDDISDIVGVAAQTKELPTATSTTEPTVSFLSVTKNGWIVLSSEDIENIFGDYSTTLARWQYGGKIEGAPVYWELKAPDSSDPKPGRLTLETPSGYYWNSKTGLTAEKNVSYDNLPQVGNISAAVYESETSGAIIKGLEIHVNFSKFDSTFEWSYPAFAKSTSTSTAADAGNINGSGSLIIDHGFNFNNFANFKPKCSYRISSQLIENSVIGSTVNTVVAKTSESEGKCTITVSSPYNMHYTVSGQINFRLDKEGK